MLAIDVKQAFDSILSGRLILYLREQVFPDKLIKLVASLTTNRTVHIRLDVEVGPSQRVVCGLPRAPLYRLNYSCYTSPLFSKSGKYQETLDTQRYGHLRNR